MMSLATIISEIWRLFKDRLKTILLGAFIIGLLAAGGRYFLGQYLYGDLQEASSHLNHVFQQEPASFRAIVTIEDGQVLSNPNLYDVYFTTPKVVEEVEAATGLDLSQTLESEDALELYKTPSYRGSIAGVRDQASGVFTFRFLVGNDAEENLTIAQAYQDILETHEIPFAHSHEIEIIQDAEIGELIDIEVYDVVPTEGTMNPYQLSSSRPMIIYGVLGFVVGMIIVLGVIFLHRLVKKRIEYAFEYTWDINDTHILVPRSDSSVGQLIQLPNYRHSHLLAQEGVSLESLGKVHNQLGVIPQDVDQIVILIQSNETTKIWYRQQYKLAKLTRKPLKIVHLIEGT